VENRRPNPGTSTAENGTATLAAAWPGAHAASAMDAYTLTDRALAQLQQQGSLVIAVRRRPAPDQPVRRHRTPPQKPCRRKARLAKVLADGWFAEDSSHRRVSSERGEIVQSLGGTSRSIRSEPNRSPGRAVTRASGTRLRHTATHPPSDASCATFLTPPLTPPLARGCVSCAGRTAPGSHSRHHRGWNGFRSGTPAPGAPGQETLRVCGDEHHGTSRSAAAR